MIAMPMLSLQSEILRVVQIDPTALQAAIEASRASGKPLGEVLVSTGRITRADLYEAMHLARKPIEIDKLASMPKWDVVPYMSGGDNRVIAVTQSDDTRRRFFVVQVKGIPESQTYAARAQASKNGLSMGGTILVSPDFMAVLLAEHKSKSARLQRQGEGDSQGFETQDQSRLQTDFDTHARTAYRMQASDIHITCRAGRGEVKFRIDGELEHYQDWTEEYTVAFCQAVYNTMTESGSTQRGFSPRERQDAVIERMFTEGHVRFRYASTSIAPSGFDVTLRIIPLEVDRRQKSMAELGYSADQQEDLDRMFAHSSGLIFFLGTTGSGKSTSMAVALEGLAIAKPGKKIRTVEQPVEYRIRGAYQTSVAREEFIPMISQMMRMDPDYMMVGETRDDETAQAVLQGARSGHLCVSTLHADGAPLAYDRLQGLSIPRHELASVGLVVGLVYQRLVQLLCPDCKITASEYADMNPGAPILDRLLRVNEGTFDGIYFARFNGCPTCRGRGIRGRTVCAEILRPTVPMLDAIARGNSREMWRHWRSTIRDGRPGDMRGRTAFEHAIWKMKQGVVSPVSVEADFKFLDEPAFKDID